MFYFTSVHDLISLLKPLGLLLLFVSLFKLRFKYQTSLFSVNFKVFLPWHFTQGFADCSNTTFYCKRSGSRVRWHAGMCMLCWSYLNRHCVAGISVECQMREGEVGVVVGPSYDQIKMNKEGETEQIPQRHFNQCCKKLLEIKTLALLGSFLFVCLFSFYSYYFFLFFILV